MSDSICLNAGFRHHIRFKQLKERLGKVGLGMYLELQDYVLEHCKDMTFCIEDEFDRICLDLEMTGFEFTALYETIVITGLGTFKPDPESVKRFIVLEKAKKHVRGSQPEGTDIYGTRVAMHCNAFDLIQPSPSVSEKGAPSFSEAAKEGEKKCNAGNLPGFRLTLEELLDDLQMEPCPTFDKWLKGEMNRAKTPKVILGLHKTNEKQVSQLMSEWGERAFLGAFRLFLYSDDYKKFAREATNFISYFLNRKAKWAEKFSEFTGEARARSYENFESKRDLASPEESVEPARSQPAESTQPDWVPKPLPGEDVVAFHLRVEKIRDQRGEDPVSIEFKKRSEQPDLGEYLRQLGEKPVPEGAG